MFFFYGSGKRIINSLFLIKPDGKQSNAYLPNNLSAWDTNQSKCMYLIVDRISTSPCKPHKKQQGFFIYKVEKKNIVDTSFPFFLLQIHMSSIHSFAINVSVPHRKIQRANTTKVLTQSFSFCWFIIFSRVCWQYYWWYIVDLECWFNSPLGCCPSDVSWQNF